MNRASRFIFSTGINDGASILCKKNMAYGLAQIHLIQEKYGFTPKACFISSPDETISKNPFRWNSGFGYGGKLNWGNGKEHAIFLNTKPNYCGILVGGLEEKPEALEIIKKIDEIKTSPLYYSLNGWDIKITWDFNVSNHFINCFKIQNYSDIKLPPYIFFIHGSVPEFKDDTYGMGLYVDKSQTLKDLSIRESTVFGTIQHLLLDSNAKDYYRFNQKVSKFSKVKRELIAEHIFGKYQAISNQFHQFLNDFNNMYLGANCTDLMSGYVQSSIFPVALRANISCYLLKGKPNFSSTIIKSLNFDLQAKELEVSDQLVNANILPHGGGYALPDIKNVIEVMEYKDQRYFVCSLSKAERLKIIRDVADLEFKYRGRAVVLKSMYLELGEILAKLTPIFSLKV